MRIRRSRSGESGLTIIEVVISTFVLAVMAAGIIGSFAYGFLMMQMARENQRATQIMLEKLETLRLYNWDQVLTPGYTPATFTDIYDPQAPAGSQGTVYSGQVTVSSAPLTTSYASEMRLITVRLSWTTSLQNIARSRQISTLVARDGVQNYVY